MMDKMFFLKEFFKKFYGWLSKPLTIAWVGLISIVLISWMGLEYYTRKHSHQPSSQAFSIHFNGEDLESFTEMPQSAQSENTAQLPHKADHSESHTDPLPSVTSSTHIPEIIAPIEPVLAQTPFTPQVREVVQNYIAEDLIENSHLGPLPKINNQGHTVFQSYSQPLRTVSGPKIAILIHALGSQPQNLLDSLGELPHEICLAFLPYTKSLNAVIDQARTLGHEILLSIPMEPYHLDLQDPGAYTLLCGLPAAQNIERLYWSLSRGAGYMGVTHYLGNKFISQMTDLLPIMKELKKRGVFYFDHNNIATTMVGALSREIQLPSVTSELIIDEELTPEHIQNRLNTLEGLALKNGIAIGAAYSHPLSISQILTWVKTLKGKGITLVPVSWTAHPREF